MGLFSKDPQKAEAKQNQRAEKHDAKAAQQLSLAHKLVEKARAKAEKKGIEVAGAIAVGHTFDDGANQFLIVFRDRVELVNRGKLGSLLRSGAGTESIPVSRISSAEVRNKGVWSVLEIHTSGNTIEFKGDQASAPYLRQVILDQVHGSESAPTTAAPDVTDQLGKLGDLHQAGVLTREEFSAKKADLLSRM